MAEIKIPPIVNDQGNISAHVAEGIQIPLAIENENGTEIDASAIDLRFISGVFSKALSADPSNPEGRMLDLTPTDLAAILHGANFRVVDYTDLNHPINRWEGKIYKRG